MMTTRTTTSWIRPAEVAEWVGDMSVACDCRHCRSHDHDSGVTCDRPAVYMIRIAHFGRYFRRLRACGIAAALCEDCLMRAWIWAIGTARVNDSCPVCGAPIGTCNDLITSVVRI